MGCQRLGETDRVVVASIDSEQSSVSVRVGDETVVLQRAADLLELSRTYVVRLIDQGSLPARGTLMC
jgi:hypothetical protein